MTADGERISLARGGAIALVSRAGSIVVSVATSVVTARALGPEGKGILAFLSTVASLAVRAGSLGLDGSFTHFYLVRRRALDEVIGVAAALSMTSGLAAGLVCIGLAATVPAMRAAAPFGLAVPYFAILPAPFVLYVSTFLFFSTGRALFFGVFDVAYRILQLAALFVALQVWRGSVTAAVWAQIAVTLLFAAMAVAAGGKAARWRPRLDWSLMREMLVYGARYYSYGLLRYVLCYGGVLMAGVFLTRRDAGLFSVALAIGEGMMLFAHSINLSFYPSVATSADRRRFTVSVVKRILVLSAGIGFVLVLVARPLIRIVYGPAFADSFAPFAFMLPGLVLLTGEQVVSSYFATQGMPWSVPAVLLAGTAIHWALAGWWARGLTQVALATAAAHVGVSLALLALFAFEKPRAGTAATDQAPDLR